LSYKIEIILELMFVTIMIGRLESKLVHDRLPVADNSAAE